LHISNCFLNRNASLAGLISVERTADTIIFYLPPLEHDPEKARPGLDPGWKPVFGKRSCSKAKSRP
jgi:hypothetical protein